MAKRYARLNWQNKPSTATPLNATNLNKMDKGIDDIDNALETLQNSIVGQVVNDPTKINNAAVIYSLANQVTQLNDNLGKLHINSVNQLNNIAGTSLTSASPLIDVYNAMPIGSALDNYYTEGYPNQYSKLFSTKKNSDTGGMTVFGYDYTSASPTLKYCIINDKKQITNWRSFTTN